jgi:HlyD family secretion protein
LEPQDISKLRIERTPQRAIGRGRTKRRLVYGAGFAAAILLALAAYAKFQSAPTVQTTTVVTAYPSQALTVLNATGYVVAQRKAAVASKATGRLEWLGVAEGSVVKENEVIARLESKDVAASAEQAAANVRVAQANLEQGDAELREAQAAFNRSRGLLAKKFISAASHDAAVGRYSKAKANIASLKAAVAAAEANLKSAQVTVDQTLIRAPFDGVVLTKSANIGDIVTPFSQAADSKGAVVTMADMSTLEVEADVAESSLSKIRTGQPCEIQLDALPETRFAGVLDRTVPTVDRSKATLLVKIRFKDIDARVLPDMSAKVAFLERDLSAQEKKSVTAVSADAIVTRAGRSVVFALKDNKVQQTSVQKGATLGELVAVQGVAAGAKLVLRPPEQLKDGAEIKLAQK